MELHHHNVIHTNCRLIGRTQKGKWGSLHVLQLSVTIVLHQVRTQLWCRISPELFSCLDGNDRWCCVSLRESMSLAEAESARTSLPAWLSLCRRTAAKQCSNISVWSGTSGSQTLEILQITPLTRDELSWLCSRYLMVGESMAWGLQGGELLWHKHNIRISHTVTTGKTIAFYTTVLPVS